MAEFNADAIQRQDPGPRMILLASLLLAAAAPAPAMPAVYNDRSAPLLVSTADRDDDEGEVAVQSGPATSKASVATAAVEQSSHGGKPAARLVASFDGLGKTFIGPQGTAVTRNPSDNSLAVGPNHIVQIVNTRMAIFTKKGKLFGEDGRALYGPVGTGNVFRGFGGACDSTNNGDAVVRYDQLADRWLVVMPIFHRLPLRNPEPQTPRGGEPARLSMPGRADQPGPAAPLFQPAPLPAAQQQRADPRREGDDAKGGYAMCYAVSATPDPLGAWYRYEFARPLFPDYPRPAIWSDGYYVPSSTGDTVIQKHACVAEREKMLKGLPAREQCLIVDGVSFLNNADLDGTQLPPRSAPNIVIAAGGSQLRGETHADTLSVWKFYVDWTAPKRTRLVGPEKILVAPYDFLCGGQLTKCVPQPRVEMRLDAQGDKLMSRVVYRRIGDKAFIVATHSVASGAGGGAVRWYQLSVDARGDVRLAQQGSFAPDADYRWLPSPAIDRFGNIGIGYSYGGEKAFVGQRFAAREAGDPPGRLTLAETVLVEGQAAQTNTLRWEDYTATSVDPTDDCTIWYVGDYLREGDANYSTRIGAFRIGRCGVAL